MAVGGAALLGAAASLSSGHFAVLGYRSGRLERSRGLAVALLTMLDDGVGLGCWRWRWCWARRPTRREGVGLVCLALLLGVLCGALIAFLTYALKDPAELTAVMLGGVALVGGAAAYLRALGAAGGRGLRGDAGAGGRAGRWSRWRARSGASSGPRT